MEELFAADADITEIFEVRNFQNARGMKIRTLQQIDSETLAPTEGSEIKYMGIAVALMPHGPAEFQFLIKALSLSEAFEKFEDSAKAFVKEMQEKASKQIITPKPGEALKLVKP